MRMHRFPDLLVGLTFVSLALPALGRAQERVVVSKEVSVGRSEATLRLEFDSGPPLEISLRDGVVYIDGADSGGFEAGDGLDAAWRALLGDAVSLEDGPLAERLRDWSPPEGLEADLNSEAEHIDDSLEEALSTRTATADGSAEVGEFQGQALVRALIGQAGRLSLLQDALDGLDEDVRIEVGRDVHIGADERVPTTLVVIQGDVTIEGTVDGDVVLIDGSLDLLPGSRIRGEVRLAEAELVQNDGRVDGDVVNVLGEQRDNERDLRAEVRDEIRSELRDELRRELRDAVRVRDEGGGFHAFRAVTRAVGGVVSNFVAVLFLGLIGLGVIAFAGENLETVADTARRAPGRAAMVGIAGSFLLIPVWVLGTVALAISIVGIPVMIAWLPLFPLAAAAAALLGYLAVARNVGEWLAGSGYRYTDWIVPSNPVYTVFGGLLGLAAFFIAGNLLSMVPFFGFLRGLLAFAGVLLSIVAAQIGFGAVLLTRAGRRREYGVPDFDEAWSRAMDVEVEVEAEDVTASDEADDASARGSDDA
jgi:hypothetical protein